MPDYYALIADPARSRVWLINTPAGWALPRLPITEKFWWQDVGPVNRAAHALGLNATTLQCVHIDGSEDDGQLFFALETADPLSAGQWIEAETLGALPLAQGGHRPLLTDWLSTLQTNAVPWYRPGWRTEALRWATEQLTQRGLALIAAPEQVRSWERSALWRLHTASGFYYFKAVTATFAYELDCSQALADWAPTHCAPVLARQPERRWLLLGDAGPRSLLRDHDSAQWEAALRQYAELQIVSASRATDLLALGLPDRRVNLLPERIATFLADTAALQNSASDLTEAQVTALRQRQPELVDACRALAASPIPAALEHGDFASGQIIASPDGAYRFIDWSDASVSFPFFSLLFFWSELEGELDDPPAARLRLRDAYLEPWTAYASRPELMELYQLAMTVSPLHHALIYHRSILPHMTHKWEMERMLPYYLRIALRQ